MKNLLIAAFLMVSFGASAQSIQCPQDQTVHLFDLDNDYNSYGDPQLSGPGNYETTSSVTIVDNSCQGNFGIIATITYNLVEVGTTASLASCVQVIQVQRALITEYTFPDDYTVSQATLDDLTPATTGEVEPATFLNNGSTHAVSYSDQVINSGPGVKIVRTWILLDWCTAQTLESVQLISVTTLTSIGSGPRDASTCSNTTVEVDNVLIRTDVPAYTIDYGTCSTTTADLTSFVNCVANINAIPATNNFIIELEKGQDYLNGVSTIDLVLTQRHILGISTLDNPCKTLAADINNDGRVTAVDLLESRKLILGIYNTLPASSSWRFYNAEYFNQNGTFPFGPINANNDLKFAKSEFPLNNLEVIAVKVGDVNNSAQK